MKSKISKILVLCAVTVGIGMSVTSCKDTAEDLYNELKTEVWGDGVTAGQGLKDQVTNLTTLLGQLQAQVDAINSCTCDMAAINHRLQDLEDELALKASTADLNNKADQAEITRLENEITTLQTFIANTYVAQTVYNQAIQNLQDQIDAINNCTCDPTIPGRLAAAEQAIIEAKAAAAAAQAAAQTAQTAAEQAQTAAAAAATAAQNAQNTADQAATAAAAASTLAGQAKTLADANQQAIEDLKAADVLINNRLASLGDSLKTAYDRAASAEARSYADSIRIDQLQQLVREDSLRIEQLLVSVANDSVRIDQLRDRLTIFEGETTQKLADLANEIAAVRQLAIDNLAEAKAYADQEIAAVRQELAAAYDDLNTKISDLEAAYKEADEVLQQQIDELNDRIYEAEQALTAIDNRLARIEDLLGRLVTSVNINGTYNPAFGSVTLPTGLNTNILIAYYGEAANTVYFPTQRTGNYVRAEEALTDGDMRMLGLTGEALYDAGETIIGEDGANAGKVYLTINPTNVDFSGLNLSLVNSQDKESSIKLNLDKMKKSDDVLRFGFTRAANNGFYEVPAYVDAADVDNVQRINFDVDKVKKIVKEIKDNRQNSNFKAVASDMYDLLMGIGLDRNAVKVSRKSDAGADSAVYSNYDIAATAVKPLSFASYEDLHVETIPGYERAMALLDRVAEEAKDKIHVAFNTINGSDLAKDIESLTITQIEIKDLSPEQLAMFEIEIDTTIVIDGLQRSIHIEKDIEVPIIIHTSKDVTVPSQTVPVPSVNITADVTNANNGTATLIVPVYEGGVQKGTATIDLGDIKVDGSSESTTVTIGEQVITVPIDYESTQTVTVSMDQLVNFGDEDGKKGIRIWITRDMKNAANSLWGTVKDQLGNVNVMLSDLQNLVGDANGLLADLNDYEKRANTAVDTYLDRAKNLIENLNDRVASLINRGTKLFQPTMFVDDNGTTHILSAAKNYPTVVDGKVTLVPTTWSLELLVPVSKKHIAVTNVFKGSASAQGGNSECLSALQSANALENLNEVIDGNKREITLTGLQRGLTYEIAYSALDFHGKISTKKYYVAVK